MNTQDVPLVQLAGRLGVERRYAVRIKYPFVDCQVLPTIYFNERLIRTHDISVGGCCLLDPAELLGPGVASDVHLILRFPNGPISVHARVVSRVENKRHVQFLNLPKAQAKQLEEAIVCGGLGQGLRPCIKAVTNGPMVIAREMWSSALGESVIIEDHLHRLAKITFKNTDYTLYKHAWPVKEVSTPITRTELAHLILFLCNVPHPSDLLTALVNHLENMVSLGAD